MVGQGLSRIPNIFFGGKGRWVMRLDKSDVDKSSRYNVCIHKRELSSIMTPCLVGIARFADSQGKRGLVHI